mgnify:FL=1
MNEILIKKLKDIKNELHPDPHYSRRSLYTILSTRREINDAPNFHFFKNKLFRISSLATALSILIMVGLEQNLPLWVIGLDSKDLAVEAEDINMHLELIDSVSAKVNDAFSIEVALEEASQSAPGALNEHKIIGESKSIPSIKKNTSSIDTALNELLD